AEVSVDPFTVYRTLRYVNPSPYMYFMKMGGQSIVGSSPEMLVRVEGSHVETHPIAGTRPRGDTEQEDAQLEAELKKNEKERAEHVMLVDLGRNDLGRVCAFGSVTVPTYISLERYSHVMHLVSRVEGNLRDDQDRLDALAACFPAGTVSGAPKIRAMEIIAELEHDRRGPYSGAVGFFDLSGNIETCITIRTLIMKDGMAHVQAGAGIVFDSDPQKEYEECQHKARALLAALDDAERGEGGEPAGSLGY
ncbi:MAG: anthranilate synthase component I family protein, partial [Chloroflexi bacterium]|nr:anthranilate synthase component I family protein [Chloroflexota bacterium]